MFDPKPIPNRAGAGFKGEHFADIAKSEAEVGFFEVHAENYMGEGGMPHRILTAIRERYPLSVHGVGLSIGADRPLDAEHLMRLKAVVDRYQPGLVSEHLAWSTHDTSFFNDLLPVPYTEETLRRVVEHIDQVQEALGRQMLLENPSTYVAFEQSTMREVDFIREIQKRAGCGLLLDVNNVHVSATNQKYDAREYLHDFPTEFVGEIHLGGHAIDSDDNGDVLLIDAHDRAVSDPVWALYEDTVKRIGARPTLIEWDNDVPEWPVLKSDVDAAEAILRAVERKSHAA
ncbi:MAG: DUF692 domain-containing protein [Hyphomicrobiaceae bacterium]|nr:DUF692 domain-containing protein [Hyphomicrobiaceae bacterium]